METKTIDSRGRLSLGSEMAGKTVLVEKTNTGWTIVPAVVIPEHEAWLWKNRAAKESVDRGLQQAAAGEFAPNPVAVDDSWADEDCTDA